MSSNPSIGMDIQLGRTLTNNPEVRERNSLASIYSSREPSLASSGRSTPYHDRMDMDLDDANIAGITENNIPELSYKTEQEKALRVDEVTHPTTNMRAPGINNEANPTCDSHEDDIINVQLPYDLHAPTEPELWSGLFHPISLYGSIEYFASDANNIKVTLNFLAKYIQSKQVDNNKAKMVWVTLYETLSHLYTGLSGIHYLLTTKPIRLGTKFRRNSRHVSLLPTAILRRMLPNLPQ